MDLLRHLDMPSVSDSSDTEDFLQELAALNDVGLLRAAMESLECGRLTPLIKEELRCRIQSRRLSEGKGELLVQFSSRTPSQPGPEELEKRDRRREQNKRAAQTFRRRRKEKGNHLIEETQRLEIHNTKLRSEIKELHEERDHLTHIIQHHAIICPLTPRQSPLTIPRESPLQVPTREPFLPLASFSSNILTATPELRTTPAIRKSPVLVHSPSLFIPVTRESLVVTHSPIFLITPTRESPVLTHSPIFLITPTRESPVSLLIINPARESPIPASAIASSPISASVIASSPISASAITSSPIPASAIVSSPISASVIASSPIPASAIISSPISASVIASSPVTMSGWSRMSPASLFKVSQSHVPGDKSPTLFRPADKQIKHSIPIRLNHAMTMLYPP